MLRVDFLSYYDECCCAENSYAERCLAESSLAKCCHECSNAKCR